MADSSKSLKETKPIEGETSLGEKINLQKEYVVEKQKKTEKSSKSGKKYHDRHQHGPESKGDTKTIAGKTFTEKKIDPKEKAKGDKSKIAKENVKKHWNVKHKNRKRSKIRSTG